MKGCDLRPGMQIGGIRSAGIFHLRFRMMRGVGALSFVSRLIAARVVTGFLRMDRGGAAGSLGSKTRSDNSGVHATHLSETPTFIETPTQILRFVSGPWQASAGLSGVVHIGAFANVPYRKLPGGRTMRSFGCNGCE